MSPTCPGKAETNPLVKSALSIVVSLVRPEDEGEEWHDRRFLLPRGTAEPAPESY